MTHRLKIYLLLILILCSGFSQKADIKKSNDSIKTSPHSIKDIQIPIDVPATLVYDLPDTEDQINILNIVVQSYASQGYLERAIKEINLLPQNLKLQTKLLLEKAFIAYYQKNNYEKTIEHLNLVEFNNQSYLLESLVKKSLFLNNEKDATEFFALINQSVIKSRTALNFVEYYTAMGNVDMAFKYNALIEFPNQKDSGWAEIAKMFLKNQKIESTDKAINSIINPKNKQHLYLSLVEISTNQNNIKNALYYTRQITDMPTREKATLLLIRAYMRIGDYRNAKMASDTLTIEENREEVIYSISLGFAKRGNVKSLTELLDTINNEQILNKTIQELSIILVENGFFEEAIQLTDYIQNSEKQLQAIQNIAYHFGMVKDYHFALLTIEQLDNDDWVNNTLIDFSYGLANSGRFEKALQVVKNIEYPSYQQIAALDILSKFDTGNLQPDFEGLLKETLQFAQFCNARTIELLKSKNKDSINAHIQYINNLIKEKDFSHYYLVMLLMDNVQLYDELGDIDQAKETLMRAAKKALRYYDDISLDQFKQLVTWLSKYNLSEEALNVINKVPSPINQLELFVFLPVETGKKLSKQQRELKAFAKQFKK